MKPQMPTQQQLLYPILEALGENGPMSARDVCDAVAQKLKVSEEIRTATATFSNGSSSNLFDRKVRWTRQSAVVAGLIPNRTRGIWELTDQGHETLSMAKPGVAFVLAKSDDGLVLWSQALTAMGYIDKGSLQLVFTSPPYPLNRQREYGGWEAERYVDTLMAHLDAVRPLLTDDGSMVINLCDVYAQGAPVLNTYQEELVVRLKNAGMNLCGKEIWVNGAKPRTTPFVTKTRERIANGFETFYWWSPSTRPKANNRNVLEPYSERHLKTIASGGEIAKAISGSRQKHPGKARYTANNGGSIPFNVTNAGPDSVLAGYGAFCRANNLPVHPARMPQKLAEKYIKLTTDAGDTVFDPFGGSLNTMEVALRLGRRCITSEGIFQYIQGGVSRIRQMPGYADHFDKISTKLWPTITGAAA